MSYEVYFPSDISARLDGIERTAHHLESGDFRVGFLAAIQVVRASFGLTTTMLIIPHREEMITHDRKEIDCGPEKLKIPARASCHR